MLRIYPTGAQLKALANQLYRLDRSGIVPIDIRQTELGTISITLPTKRIVISVGGTVWHG